MIELIKNIPNFISTTDYSIIITTISIILLIWGVYTNIKYLCLKKASEMVAKVEKESELSGEEKFTLCVVWINEELPKIFRNSLFKSIISKLVNHAYGNSFDYMKNYIKRKTGQDVGEILEQVKEKIDIDENQLDIESNNKDNN